MGKGGKVCRRRQDQGQGQQDQPCLCIESSGVAAVVCTALAVQNATRTKRHTEINNLITIYSWYLR